MPINIFHRYSELDNKHEYSIVVEPFRSEEYANYWTYWLWFFIGGITNGNNSDPYIIPFANTWDENSRVIKIYKDTSDSRKCAARVIAFIKKHNSKNNLQ